jgi:CRP-like cAMP-binding protein
VRSPLRHLLGPNSALRRLEVSWFAVNFAEWAYITALAIHCFHAYGALAVGLIGARFAPGALLGSALLARMTQSRPTRVLRYLSLGRAAAAAGAGFAVAAHAPLALIVAIVWLDAVVSAPYRPVQSAILPALATTPRELSAAAGSIPASKALAQAAGALAGSLALLVIAPGTVVGATAVVFVFGAALIAPLRPDRSVAVVIGPALERRRETGGIRSGFGQIARQARTLLLLGGTRSLTRGLWTALTVFASIRLLHLGSAGVGILMAAAGVGALAAIPLSLRFAGRPRLAGPTALSFALAGAPMLLVGVLAARVPAVLLIALWGAAFALADALSNSLVHRVVEFRLLAPSVAAIESSKLLLEGIGALLAPALLALFGIRDALIIAGAPLPLLVLFSRGGLLDVDRRAAARSRPLAALRATPSFRGMTMLALETLAASLTRETVEAGTDVVRQGELGDRFYLIDSGSVEVTVDGWRVAVLGAGGSFGEKALLRATPRSATVTTLQRCSLWSLDGADFVAAATGSEGRSARRVLGDAGGSLTDVLAGVPLFGAVDRSRLAAMGTEVVLAAGAEIVREGESGDSFYVLLDGETDVTVGGRHVRVLHSGDSFGEIALLHSVPRTASVTARTQVRMWTLGRDAFAAALAQAAPLGAVALEGPLPLAGMLV